VTLSNTRIAEFAQRALLRTDEEIARAQELIRADIPRKVANVVANMLDAECECRKRLVTIAEKTQSGKLTSLTKVHDRLVGLIETAYAQVTQSLMREFRIFTAANTVAFALLGLLASANRKTSLPLVLPAVVLLSAVILTAGLYLFNQDWLHTVLYGEYVGYAYFGYLGSAALFFIDIAFNRARISELVLRAVQETVGAALRMLPC